MFNVFFSGTNLYALVDVEIRLKYLPAVCCSWLSETKLLVGYASGSIKIWNIQNQECLTTINEDRVVLQVLTFSLRAFLNTQFFMKNESSLSFNLT